MHVVATIQQEDTVCIRKACEIAYVTERICWKFPKSVSFNSIFISSFFSPVLHFNFYSCLLYHVLFSSLFFVWTFIVWFWLRICLMVTRISIKFRDDKTKITLFLYFWNFVCYWVTTQCLLFLCINCKDGYNSFVALIHTTAD